MAQLFTSGRIADILLAIIVIEAVAISAYWRATGRGIAPRDLLPNLIAGAMLVLALRFALVGMDWTWIAGALAAAGAASVVDLKRRWR